MFIFINILYHTCFNVSVDVYGYEYWNILGRVGWGANLLARAGGGVHESKSI